MSLADPASHAGLLDAFGVPAPIRAQVAEAWRTWRDAIARLDLARGAIAAAERDEEWLRHAVDELATLAPQPDEEEALAR
jgi:DNA repair protein RecN (Recombination protein N)